MSDKRVRCVRILIFAIGFGLACQIVATPTPSPTAPAIPESLLNLPREAQTKCPADIALRLSRISLWRYAARPASDSSNTNPDRGGQVGTVEFCVDIVVLSYEWSSVNQEFWVLIDNQSGEQGWLPLEFVELN